MSTLSHNIRYLRTLKKWSQEELASRLGIPRARIGSYEEQRCDPPIETLVRISALFHIAVDALVKCDLRKFDDHSFIEVAENRILFPIVVDPQQHDQVEVVTVRASAGYLHGYADPEYIGKLPLMQLPFKIQGKHRAFPIRGDSMLPLRTGCIVVGRFAESWREIRDGQTAVVVTREEGIVYKRIYKKGKQVELHSDNPLYQPYTVSYTDIMELWHFACSLNPFDEADSEISLHTLTRDIQALRQDIRKWKDKN